jgi:glycosyltransferase involved in cell wall biosynthesis
MRLAWFSPLAPVRSGIATYSAMILPRLAPGRAIDVFVDDEVWAAGGPEAARPEHPDRRSLPGIAWAGCTIRPAHDFVPAHHLQPYDLIVHQLGNARCHDYQWPYLLRFPGLVVLHDAQVHQSRAAALLSRGRKDDYRAEFAFCHPDAPAGVAEWVVSGLGGNAAAGLYPLTALALATARAAAVHHQRLAASLREDHPRLPVSTINHGAPDLLDGAAMDTLQPADGRGITFAAFGLVTPEKRVPQILRALAAIRSVAPGARLRLVGGVVPHYDVAAEAAGLGLEGVVEITGFVDDAAFDRHVREADVCLCLRWPTNREASGPWYRCLSAAKPTIINDLTHLVDVPTLDPRTWTVLAARAASVPAGEDAVAVSLDILDEDHSLALAMRRLALDAGLRAAIGRAARHFWAEHHTLARMTSDYARVLDAAAAAPVPPAPEGLPAHVRDDGTRTLVRLAADAGVAVDLLE